MVIITAIEHREYIYKKINININIHYTALLPDPLFTLGGFAQLKNNSFFWLPPYKLYTILYLYII
jgi:hypothetical protein